MGAVPAGVRMPDPTQNGLSPKQLSLNRCVAVKERRPSA